MADNIISFPDRPQPVRPMRNLDEDAERAKERDIQEDQPQDAPGVLPGVLATVAGVMVVPKVSIHAAMQVVQVLQFYANGHIDGGHNAKQALTAMRTVIALANSQPEGDNE